MTFLTCKQFVEKHPWPPYGGLQHLIFHAETNGFNKVVRRCGRRVLINEQEFFRWIDEQKCTTGIKALESYKKEWNERHGCWDGHPLHNFASHGADAFRMMAVSLGKLNR